MASPAAPRPPPAPGVVELRDEAKAHLRAAVEAKRTGDLAGQARSLCQAILAMNSVIEAFPPDPDTHYSKYLDGGADPCVASVSREPGFAAGAPPPSPEPAVLRQCVRGYSVVYAKLQSIARQLDPPPALPPNVLERNLALQALQTKMEEREARTARDSPSGTGRHDPTASPTTPSGRAAKSFSPAGPASDGRASRLDGLGLDNSYFIPVLYESGARHGTSPVLSQGRSPVIGAPPGREAGSHASDRSDSSLQRQVPGSGKTTTRRAFLAEAGLPERIVPLSQEFEESLEESVRPTLPLQQPGPVACSLPSRTSPVARADSESQKEQAQRLRREEAEIVESIPELYRARLASPKRVAGQKKASAGVNVLILRQTQWPRCDQLVDLRCIVPHYRETLKALVECVAAARAHFIYGPRKSGKSALLRAFGDLYQFPVMTLSRESLEEADRAGIAQVDLLKGALSCALSVRPCMLVIDELPDLLGPLRPGALFPAAGEGRASFLSREAWRAFLGAALPQLEGLTEEEQVHLVVVASAPQTLEKPDIAGIRSKLRLQPPDAGERMEMVSDYVSAPEVARQTVRATERYLLADLARVLQQATVIASHGQSRAEVRGTASPGGASLQERRRQDRDRVSLIHIRSAMRLFPPSVGEQYYRSLGRWEATVFPEGGEERPSPQPPQ